MSRQAAFVVILVAGVFAVASGIASQQRPYNELMKDINATYASVKKNLDGKAAALAAADAAKLETLFKDTEAFWAQFKTKDALDAAKAAQQGAAAIAVAANANDLQKAQ